VILDATADLVATANLPMRFVEGDPFRNFVGRVSGGNPPSVREARAEIILKANAIRAQITPTTELGPYLSLLIDGASAADRVWLGVCLATFKGISFFRIVRMADQRALTIAQMLLPIIRDLEARGFVIVSVVTDNAANEIAGIREIGHIHYPCQSPVHIFRIPCLSHTANLAVQDFLQKFFPDRDLFKDVNLLRKVLPKGVLKKLPLACPTRWLSLGNAIRYIVSYKSEINILVNRSRHEGKVRAIHFMAECNFDPMRRVFDTLDRFMKWTESEHSCMCQAWHEIIRTVLTLRTEIGDLCAISMADSFIRRMAMTANLGQLILGYLVTQRGLVWYQSLPEMFRDNDPAFHAATLTSKTNVGILVRPMVLNFAKLLKVDPQTFERTFASFLHRMDPREMNDCQQFWKNQMEAMILDFHPGDHETLLAMAPIATMALILCHLPCSEAPVERVFSILREIFGSRRHSMKEDLVEAKLTIILNRCDHVAPFLETYQQNKMTLDLVDESMV
jgi:hypothetical protein